MIKTLTNLFKQDKEKFVVPKGVQDVIPVVAIFDDGIFKVGKDKYSKTFKFTDINYAVASREDKEAMFLEYSELLNSLDSGATTKITINNRRLNRLDFEKTILIPTKGDDLDVYREEYNKMLLEKATGANSIVQDKYVTISINKKNVEDARTYFARVGADLIAHFGRLGSKCVELETDERLRIIHDFYRVGEESSYHFDIKETRKKGHSFKDYVCPDTMEFEKDYFLKIKEFIDECAKYPKLLQVAMGIEGLICGRSIHASAVYLFNDDFLEHNARMKAPNGVYTTQFNMADSDYQSGLKMDFLTVENLDKIRHCMDMLVEAGYIKWQGSLRSTYDKYLHPDVLDYDTEEMWDWIGDNRCTDLFQFDTQVGLQSAKKIKHH